MLQCHVCNKPFTNSSSHSRHVRYCIKVRSRPRLRQRSCQACSASKVKCTFQRPSCARCDKKGVGCVYHGECVTAEEATSPHSSRPSPPLITQIYQSPREAGIQPVPLDVEPWQFSQLDHDLIDWSAIDLLLPQDFSSTAEPTDMPSITGLVGHSNDDPWSSTTTTTTGSFLVETGPGFSTDITHAAPSETWQDTTTSPTTTDDHENFSFPACSTPPTAQTKPQQRQHPPPTQTTTITGSLSPIEVHPSVLTLLPNPTPASPTATQYSIKSIIRGLRAYPLMMLQKSTFPPLIHTPSLNMDIDSPVSPSNHPPTPGKILSRCMSISHLYALRTPETLPFLWDAILQQTTYFSENMASFSQENLMAAIQAQLIYVLMRVVAQATTPANLNYSVMYVFKKLCERFIQEIEEPFCYEPGAGVPRRWEDWVMGESWRRMKCIFFLVGKIVNVDIGASVKCVARYVDVNYIMLPCRRALWEATSRGEWEVQVGGLQSSGYHRGLDTIGALLDAHRGDLGMGGGSSVALDRWNVEADGLGSLLNASLGMV